MAQSSRTSRAPLDHVSSCGGVFLGSRQRRCQNGDLQTLWDSRVQKWAGAGGLVGGDLTLLRWERETPFIHSTKVNCLLTTDCVSINTSTVLDLVFAAA